MSYMNDDCDPFGVPYPKENSVNKQTSSEEVINYSLKEYRELLDQKEEFKKTLEHLTTDIKDAEKYLTKKIRRICDGIVLSVKFEKDKAIVDMGSVSLSSLLKLKEELNLTDIEIRCREDDYIFYLYLLW